MPSRARSTFGTLAMTGPSGSTVEALAQDAHRLRISTIRTR